MKKTLLVLLVAAAVTTGCIHGDDGAAGQTVDFVPDGVDAVVQFDMGVFEDPTTEDLGNALIDMEREQQGEMYDGPESYEEIWQEIEDETELDPRGLQEATAFGGIPDDPMVEADDEWGVVVSTTWSEEQVIEEIEDEASVEEGTYNGHPFLTVTPDAEFEDVYYVAVLGDGLYVLGDEASVQDSVDVAAGDAEPLSGELREEIDRIAEGYVNFAFQVPDDAVPEGEEPAMEFDMGAFDEVGVVSGSYYTEGDSLGTSFNLRTGDDASAEELEEGIDGLLAFAGTMAQEEEFDEALDAIQVTRDGSTVEIRYETTVDDLVETLEALDDMGPAAPGPQPGVDEDFGEEEFDDDFGEDFDDFEEEFEDLE